MSQSNSIWRMKNVIGTVLLISGLIFGTIILFGLMKTNFDADRIILFKIMYFVFVAVLLGIIYISNQDVFSTVIEHALIIVSILLISASVAMLAGSLKTAHDANYVLDYGSPEQLEAQNMYYSQYADVLKNDISTINDENVRLVSEIDNLTEKITNKTPVIVETVIILPPEIIYVDDTAPASQIYYDDDEYEEDDD